jgi:hypothetical protein
MRFRDDPYWQNYWHNKMKRGQVTRLVAVPPFLEASSLLMSAAELWIGRYGAGRQTAKNIRTVAYALRNPAEHWKICSLGWLSSDNSYNDAALILHNFRDHRKHYIPTIIDKELKSPRSARIMVETAAKLIDTTLPIIKKTGIEYNRHKEAEHFEDLLEKLCDGPFCTEPEDPTTEEQMLAVQRRGVMRVCEGFSNSVSLTFQYAPSRYEKDKKPFIERWSALTSFFHKEQSRFYKLFASLSGLDEDDHKRILAVEDTAMSFNYSDNHYASMDDLIRTGELASALISVLLMSVDLEPADYGNEDLWPMLESGVKLLTSHENG